MTSPPQFPAQGHPLAGRRVLATGHAIPPVRTAARIGDVERMRLRIERAATLLGWTPRIGPAEGIAALAPTSMEASA